MKKQIIFAFSTLFLLAISPFAAAKTIYLSSAGTDSSDGSSELRAVKTLSMALTLAKNNDEVHVMDFIDLTQEPNLPGNLSDINLNGTSSRSFGGETYHTWNVAGTQGVKLLNRKITIRGEDKATCGFDGKNKTRLLNIYGSEGVVLENLTFINGAADRGAAFYVTKENNDNKPLLFSIKNCIVRNNIAENDGGAIFFTDKLGKKHIIRIEASAFIGNKANSWHGGAFYIDNQALKSVLETTIINTTVYGNQAKVCGGAFYYHRGRVGSELNLVNCTFTGNTIVSDNTGLGPGFQFNREESGGDLTSTRNVVKRIYNTIIENNYIADKPGTVMDMSFSSYTPEDGLDMFIHNSFVGRTIAKKHYTSPLSDGNFVGYGKGSLSGLADPSAYIDSQQSIPLNMNAPALHFGNADYLRKYGISTDQSGDKRTYKNGRCASGAIEVPVEKQSTGEAKTYQHFILSGQSLSTGYQSYPALSDQTVPGNYMIGDQVWINYGNPQKEIFEPLVSNIAEGFRWGSDVKSRAAGTNAECPLTGMVNHLQLKTKGTVNDANMLATSVGTGGASIEELSKESQTRNYYNDFLYSLIFGAKIAQETNSSLYVPAIFWMQGEFNYDPNPEKGFRPGVPNATDKASYKKNLVSMKNNMQNDIHNYYGQTQKPVFITYQTGAQYMRDTISISMAQLEVSNEQKDVICAGPIYQVTDRGGHLDPNGYRWYGEMLAKVYYKTQILGEDFKPLQPKEISRGNLSNQLVIKFHVPQSPLVLDVQTVPKIRNYGFDIFLDRHADQNRQIITDIAIQGDSVILTCQKALTGNVIVSYAGSTARIDTQEEGKNHLQGHGNLRDSDNYPAYYTYIDLDKKREDGTYFYSREEKETTLRPDFEPKDENGQVIYNKPYPLYNFGVAFYYTLKAGKDKYTVPGF